MASNYLICFIIFVFTPSVYFTVAQSIPQSIIDCRKETTCVINLEISEKKTLEYQDGRGVKRSAYLLPNSSLCDEELYIKGKICQEIDLAKYPGMIIMDGINRTVLTVNGSIPGPRIRATTNSTLRINVQNKLQSTGVTIHWHGIHQRGTPGSDGVGTISQAEIQPNEVFLYEFTAYPSGTHWYHSHVLALRSEGLYGALTVEDPNDAESVKYQYDRNEDEVIIIQDWQHSDATDILEKFANNSSSAFKFRGEVYQPTRGPDNTEIGPLPFTSGVINGRGWFTNENGQQFKPELVRIQVEQRKRCRLRIIGAQQVYAMRVSVEGHRMKLIESDGVEVAADVPLFDYIIVHSGERYDVLVDTTAAGSYWIKAETLEIDLNTPGNPFPHEALAIFDVVEGGNFDLSTLPPNRNRVCTGSDLCEIANCPYQKYLPSWNLRCHHFGVNIRTPTSYFQPLTSTDINDEFFLNFAFDGLLNNSAVNGRRFVYPETPLQVNGESAITQSCNNCDYNTDNDCQCTHTITLEPNRNILLVLTNIDNNGPIPGGTAHPVHVHGHSFAVLKMGFPVYDSNGFYVSDNTDVDCQKNGTTNTCYSPRWRNNRRPTDFNWVNPPQKDTLVIPAGGYAALFFKSDNPGWWFVHCHIEVHMLEGMALVMYEKGSTQIIPAPNVNKDIFGVRSRDYELTFQYSIGSDDSFTSITCGFGTTEVFKALLSKLPGQEAALTGGTTVADIRIGANPNPTPGGGLVDLKFTLRNLDDNDRQRYLCLLYYRKGNADKLLASGGLNLNLLGGTTAAEIGTGANPNPTPGAGLVDLKFTLRNLDDNDRQRYLCLLHYRKGNASECLVSDGLNFNLTGTYEAQVKTLASILMKWIESQEESN